MDGRRRRRRHDRRRRHRPTDRRLTRHPHPLDAPHTPAFRGGKPVRASLDAGIPRGPTPRGGPEEPARTARRGAPKGPGARPLGGGLLSTHTARSRARGHVSRARRSGGHPGCGVMWPHSAALPLTRGRSGALLAMCPHHQRVGTWVPSASVAGGTGGAARLPPGRLQRDGTRRLRGPSPHPARLRRPARAAAQARTAIARGGTTSGGGRSTSSTREQDSNQVTRRKRERF